MVRLLREGREGKEEWKGEGTFDQPADDGTPDVKALECVHQPLSGTSDQSAAVQSSEAGPDRGSVSTAVIESATAPKKMYVKCSSNVKGKRVFDKNHYCLYCSKSSTNLTKYLFNKHKDEVHIKQIMMHTKMSPEWKLELVRNLGDYRENCEVRSKGGYEIIPWRSPP